MRIDKFMSDNGIASRKDANRMARNGQITVNGVLVKDASLHIDPDRDVVSVAGEVITHAPLVYVMLNKPMGYVSATEDGHYPTVLTLLPRYLQDRGLFPCGRLDKDTTGLMLLTNDGQLSHLLLSPKRHVEKRYAFTCAEPLVPYAEEACEKGMTLGNGEILLPAWLYPTSDRMGGEIVLKEGKYHQIKRMMGAMGNRIVTLKRIAFGPLQWDSTLPEGEWRLLTEQEISALKNATTQE